MIVTNFFYNIYGRWVGQNSLQSGWYWVAPFSKERNCLVKVGLRGDEIFIHQDTRFISASVQLQQNARHSISVTITVIQQSCSQAGRLHGLF